MSKPRPVTTASDASRSIEPLLSTDALAGALSCGRRTVERLRADGRLPKPDLFVGKMPRWTAETIRRWIAEQVRVN
jgi:predicted DNA-binding transcriptional regulator AlpA